MRHIPRVDGSLSRDTWLHSFSKKTQSNEASESQDNSVEEVVKGGKNGVKTSQNLLKNKTTDVDLIILTILSLLFAFYVVLYGLVYTTSSSYSNNWVFQNVLRLYAI